MPAPQVTAADGMLLRGAGFRSRGPGTCSVCSVPFEVGFERRKAYRSRTFAPHCVGCAVRIAAEHRRQSLENYRTRYGLQAEKD